MKLHLFTLCALLVFALAATAFAETPEATTKRVNDLEKAILIYQEDLSKLQIDHNTLRGNLRKALTDLSAEIAARKDLLTKLDRANVAQNELAALMAKEIVDRQTLATKLDNLLAQVNGETAKNLTALNLKIDGMQTNLTTLTTKTDAQALKNDQDIAGINKLLDAEKTDRTAGDKANSDALIAQKAAFDKQFASLQDAVNEANRMQKEAADKTLAEQKKSFDDQLAALKADFANQLAQAKADNDTKLAAQKADADAKLAAQGTLIAGLSKSLENEKTAREDAQKQAADAQTKLSKQQKKDRTLGFLGLLTSVIGLTR